MNAKSPLTDARLIVRRMKALYRELEGDNHHKANLYLDMALANMRLLVYEIEDAYAEDERIVTGEQ